MRKTPPEDQGRAARIGAAIARHPREFVGLLMASIAMGWIFTNALFLQKGPHPAPIFAAPAKVMVPLAPPRPHTGPGAASGAVAEPARVQPAVRHVESARKNDPIGALLAPTPRMLAVQQALADFAYGRVTPTGVYDPQTRAAIERFQKARGLPVDGQLSERTLRELAIMAGRSFE